MRDSRQTVQKERANALTPLRYLAGWRVQVAQHLLRHTSLSMIDVTERTGYESEAAFSRAFKRYYGQPPAMWRVKSTGYPQ